MFRLKGIAILTFKFFLRTKHSPYRLASIRTLDENWLNK